MPPSPETSRALVAAFAERNIKFVPGRRIASLDAGRGVTKLDDGTELPYGLFLGVPKHRAPEVVENSGMGLCSSSLPCGLMTHSPVFSFSPAAP